MSRKPLNPQVVQQSHWHSFLYFSSAFIGMSCGRCVAELVMVATNYVSNDNYFNEDDRATQGWMLLMAGSLGLVAGLAFAHAHNQAHAMHSGNVLLNGLKAGKLKFTGNETFDFRENDAVYAEVLPLAKACSEKFELVGSGFDKQPVLDRLSDFKHGLIDAYASSESYCADQRAAYVSSAIIAGLRQFSSTLQEVVDSAFESTPLIKASMMQRFIRCICCLGFFATQSKPAVHAPSAIKVLSVPLVQQAEVNVGAGDVEKGVELSQKHFMPYQPPGSGGSGLPKA
ncbi:MAG: hypothetical protein P1U63_00820 [Coxiellaceae bacterium]|nr:hypothetical protein [Coxiellaceae bacterium]